MNDTERLKKLLQTMCFQCMSVKKNANVCVHCGYDDRQYECHPHYLEPGTLLKDRYLLGKPLGSDGFNNTYMAFDITTNLRMVAKEYFPAGLATRGVDRHHVRPNSDEPQNELFVFGKRAFLKESMILADIRMQHLMSVVNYFSENNTAYMMVDFIDGTDLARHLSIKGGCLKVSEAIDIILPILSTLDKLHKKNIYHYNLSLSKIMIVPQGYPIITGFGYTKHLLDKQDSSIRQTIRFSDVAPEQFLTNGKMGAWSDVYSCGILLYRITTGKNPPNANERLKKDQWVSAKEIHNIEIPKDLSDVIDQAVCLDTGARYNSAREFYQGVRSKIPKQSKQSGKMVLFFLMLIIIIAGIAVYQLLVSQKSQRAPKKIPAFEAVKTIAKPQAKAVQESISAPSTQMNSVSENIFPKKMAEQPSIQALTKTSQETVTPKPEVLLRICGDAELCQYLMTPLVREYLAVSGYKQISRHTDVDGNTFIQSNKDKRSCQVAIEEIDSEKISDWLQYGHCDVLVTGRKRMTNSMTSLSESDHNPTEYMLARDAIVIMLHPHNPIQSLSIKQVKDIFLGKITHWDQAGGKKAEIHTYTPKASSDLFQTFQKQYLNASSIPATKQFHDLSALSSHLKKDPDGIGLCSLPFIKKNNPLAIADHEIDPVRPGYFSVSIDTYLMIRQIYLYSILVSAADMTLPFITYAQSKKGQAIVSACGYVDCKVKALGFRRDLWQKPFNKAVFEKLVQITRNAQKLSMNFYFEKNQYQLTPDSYQKLKRLMSWLKERDSVIRVYAIGYSDTRGSYRHNCLVALKRAETVAREMKMRGIYVDEIVTACEEFPIATNQTETGRYKNRRVEIWIRSVKMP